MKTFVGLIIALSTILAPIMYTLGHTDKAIFHICISIVSFLFIGYWENRFN